MIHLNPSVDEKITREQIDADRARLTRMKLSDDEYARQLALIEQKEKDMRYDPDVFVVVELISEDERRRYRSAPLFMSRTYGEDSVRFAFWGKPRPKRELFGNVYSLDAWQEVMPADMILPRCDNMPHIWKIVADPREGTPLPLAGMPAPHPKTQPEPMEDADATEEAIATENATATEDAEDSDDLDAREPVSDEVPEDDFSEPMLGDEADDEQYLGPDAGIDEEALQEEYDVLAEEILYKSGRKKGKIKSSADEEKVARFNELRDLLD